MSQYSMMIQWSDEDQLFLVTIPEFAERGYDALYAWQHPRRSYTTKANKLSRCI